MDIDRADPTVKNSRGDDFTEDLLGQNDPCMDAINVKKPKGIINNNLLCII
jgi:hypothetical protein